MLFKIERRWRETNTSEHKSQLQQVEDLFKKMQHTNIFSTIGISPHKAHGSVAQHAGGHHRAYQLPSAGSEPYNALVFVILC